MIQRHGNISIILKHKGRIVGYLLAIPQHAAFEELKDDDPGMRPDDDRYYIETIGILPDYTDKGGFSLMLDKLLEASGSKVLKLSLHARVTNRFSEKVRHKLTVSAVRRIEQWKYYQYSEPADYIEGTFSAPP